MDKPQFNEISELLLHRIIYANQINLRIGVNLLMCLNFLYALLLWLGGIYTVFKKMGTLFVFAIT